VRAPRIQPNYVSLPSLSVTEPSIQYTKHSAPVEEVCFCVHCIAYPKIPKNIGIIHRSMSVSSQRGELAPAQLISYGMAMMMARAPLTKKASGYIPCITQHNSCGKTGNYEG
jgi:hypothetical protein